MVQLNYSHHGVNFVVAIIIQEGTYKRMQQYMSIQSDRNCTHSKVQLG